LGHSAPEDAGTRACKRDVHFANVGGSIESKTPLRWRTVSYALHYELSMFFITSWPSHP